jgi:AcrR family transcriptional regulator
LSKDDWVQAALSAIAEGGLDAVAVEPLARRLGVTKGSFYAHFSSRDDLIEAALASWERSHGKEGLEQFAAIEDPVERLDAVMRAAIEFSRGERPSVHIRLMDELDDRRVRASVRRVNAGRIERLTATFAQLGLGPRQAELRARIFYAAFLGLIQMSRESPSARTSERERRRLLAEVRSLFVTEGRAGEREGAGGR